MLQQPYNGLDQDKRFIKCVIQKLYSEVHLCGQISTTPSLMKSIEIKALWQHWMKTAMVVMNLWVLSLLKQQLQAKCVVRSVEEKYFNGEDYSCNSMIIDTIVSEVLDEKLETTPVKKTLKPSPTLHLISIPLRYP